MVQRIGESLYREGGVICCACCKHILCISEVNPKEACFKLEGEVGKANPWIALRNHGRSKDFKLVEYVCPSCGSLIDVEQRLRTDSTVWHDYILD